MNQKPIRQRRALIRVYRKHHRGHSQPDKTGSRKAELDRSRGSKSLEGQPSHPGELGAGSKHAARAGTCHPTSNSGPHLGGRASLSLSGIAGAGRARWAGARRQEGKASGTEVAPEVQAPSPRQQAQAPRVVIGETYGQHACRLSRGIHAAAIEAGQADAARAAGQEPSPLQQDLAATRFIQPAAGTLLAMPRCWEQPGTTPAPCTLFIRRDKFAAFMRLSEREVRPVEEVMREWVHDCADLIHQREFAHRYGDAQPLTPAMRLAAIHADERERSGYVDDEAAVAA